MKNFLTCKTPLHIHPLCPVKSQILPIEINCCRDEFLMVWFLNYLIISGRQNHLSKFLTAMKLLTLGKSMMSLILSAAKTSNPVIQSSNSLLTSTTTQNELQTQPSLPSTSTSVFQPRVPIGNP